MSTTTRHSSAPQAEAATTDPREQITYGVLMAGGRLAPRSFSSRQEAEDWAQEDEQVVAWNLVCDCDM